MWLVSLFMADNITRARARRYTTPTSSIRSAIAHLRDLSSLILECFVKAQ
jgi:hypothetical protein